MCMYKQSKVAIGRRPRPLCPSNNKNISICTRRVQPPNGGRLHEPFVLLLGPVYAGRRAPARRPALACSRRRPAPACGPASPVALAKTAATVRKCAFSPNCWGTGGGGGGVEMGTYWRPTVPNPHASPKVRCAVSEI